MINGHGDDLYRYADICYNFSSNIYNRFCHDGLYECLAAALPSVTNYPEPSATALEAALAGSMGIEPSQVIATAGATEAIYLIANMFRRSTSFIFQPTFAEYGDACRIYEHRIKPVYSLNIATEYAAAAKEDSVWDERPSALFWLCNPNNPTGMVIDKEEMVRVVSSHPNCLFVIDASYADYTSCPTISAQEGVALPNLILIHSMTKEYGVPGLRLGYLTAPSALAEQMRRLRMPWTVSALSMRAAKYLLDNKAKYQLPLEELLRQRQRIADAFAATKVIDVWPSDSHILLCQLRIGHASALKDWLAENRHILIRDASNFEGLDSSFFRIAAQGEEENSILINAVREWINQLMTNI
ncbi:MAG: aminotransferase class I/II-fold pyridoxal phosphate-dependent enzyme [Bacteroidaceae bacterium]|nr:aminotransferase class I/II-fold pyridoxal phosphate-dependent enzyme [Bacteroidaceae bacterium]